MRALSLSTCIAGAVLLLASCTLKQQMEEAQAFGKCKFRLASVTDTELAHVAIQNKKNVSDLNLGDGLKLTEAALKKTVPLSFTLNLEVENPNKKTAAMNRLEFILLFDDTELFQGTLEKRAEIPPKGTAIVPLDVSLDLVKVLSGQNAKAMLNLAFNIAGEGKKPTRLTMMAKPTVDIGGTPIAFPDYITVKTEFTAEQGKAMRKDLEEKLAKEAKKKS